MIRNTLIALAVASTAALGASAANAGSYGGYDNGYNDNHYQPVGYYCHWHTKKKVIRVLVGYDYYGYPIYKKRIKYVKFCHKHYNSYNAY